MAQTMRAWQAAQPGAFKQTLKLHDDVPRPSEAELKDGQVLVEVARAGLNPADYKVCEIGLASRAITSFPKTPGMDLSGHVVAVAQGVTEVKAGDAVIGRANPKQSPGSLGQFLVLDRDAYAPLPVGFDLEQAAGAPTVALTAYQCIAPYVKPGDKVFVNGGSGGVGLSNIQVAKALGCHITVTCSTGKADLCKGFGADDVIDYRKEDVLAELRKRGQVFSLCIDNVGDSPSNLYASCGSFLLPGSKFVFVGGHVSAASMGSILKTRLLPSFLGGGSHQFVFFLTENKRKDLETVRDWMAEGKLKVNVDSTYSFEEADKAIEHVRKGAAGKVLVRVQEK